MSKALRHIWTSLSFVYTCHSPACHDACFTNKWVRTISYRDHISTYVSAIQPYLQEGYVVGIGTGTLVKVLVLNTERWDHETGLSTETINKNCELGFKKVCYQIAWHMIKKRHRCISMNLTCKCISFDMLCRLNIGHACIMKNGKRRSSIAQVKWSSIYVRVNA